MSWGKERHRDKIQISVKSSGVHCTGVSRVTVESGAPIAKCSAHSTFMRAVTWDAIPGELPCPDPKPVDSVGSVSRCLDTPAVSSVLAADPFAMLGLETVPNRRPAVEGARGVLIPTACTDWDDATPLAPPFLPVHEDWKPPWQAWEANFVIPKTNIKMRVVTIKSTARRFRGSIRCGHKLQE